VDSLFATFGFGFLALINGLALALGIALGHVSFATAGQACGFMIFSLLTVVYARRWRKRGKG
jgi:membrane protein implicated in regulation of membrane protease activity